MGVSVEKKGEDRWRFLCTSVPFKNMRGEEKKGMGVGVASAAWGGVLAMSSGAATNGSPGPFMVGTERAWGGKGDTLKLICSEPGSGSGSGKGFRSLLVCWHMVLYMGQGLD
jgi:hypothetical protein